LIRDGEKLELKSAAAGELKSDRAVFKTRRWLALTNGSPEVPTDRRSWTAAHN